MGNEAAQLEPAIREFNMGVPTDVNVMRASKRIGLFFCAGAAVCLLSFARPEHQPTNQIWFIENSTQFVEDTEFYDQHGPDSRPQDILTSVVNALKENPTAVMEIIGNSDDHERKQGDLGQRRSETVRDSLVLRGIASGRLVPRSSGDNTPLIDKATIKRMKNDEERSNARQENRRVDFNIVSFDWKP